MQIRIRDAEGCETQPLLQWDSVWVQQPLQSLTAEGGYCDWALAGPEESDNSGGLRAKAALETAVLIQLFTDRHAEEDQTLPDESGDRRGWWGDSVDLQEDLGERDIGSYLWLLERSTLSDETARQAEIYALEALEPLIEQGVVARSEVVATAQPADGFLGLEVRLFSDDDQLSFDRKFDLIWDQVHR